MDKLALYKKYQPEIKSGDLIEWGSNDMIGRAIRWFTKQDVNHSSFVLRIDWKVLQDRRFILESVGKGLDLRLLSDRIEAFDGSIWWYPLKPAYRYIGEDVAGWGLEQKARGKRYDYESLFKNAVSRVSMNAEQFLCSEYYQAALLESGVFLSRDIIRPGEFSKYSFLEPRIKLL